MKLFLKHATSRSCVSRSIKVALVVGTVLALINHADLIMLREKLTMAKLFQIFLTYLVPYAVSTYSSAMQARDVEMQDGEKIK